MRAEDLMIRDWVSINENDEYTPAPYNKPYQIQISKGADIDRADEVTFEPILLTAEILEKNGWKRDYDKEWKYNNSHCFPTYLYQWVKERFEIETQANRDGFIIPDIIGHRFYYVHQLQHILRLCGMDELANNFKV